MSVGADGIDRGTFGTMGGVQGEQEGVLGGGGFIDSQIPFSAQHGLGVVPGGVEGDPNPSGGGLTPGEGVDLFTPLVRGWDARFIEPRVD